MGVQRKIIQYNETKISHCMIMFMYFGLYKNYATGMPL
jgi:hypothetical protein